MGFVTVVMDLMKNGKGRQYVRMTVVLKKPPGKESFARW
jgi:hypothetical protein